VIPRLLRRLGFPLALATVLAVAAVLLWKLEWWPAVPIALLATLVIVATRWRLDQGRVRRAALGIALGLLLVAGGIFLFFLAQFQAVPCESCTDNSAWLWPGLFAMLTGMGFLVASLWTLAQAGQSPVESPPRVPSR
jgi:hypothetical protein